MSATTEFLPVGRADEDRPSVLDTDTVIENRTARRIAIKQGGGGRLVIPAFDRKGVGPDALAGLELAPWVQGGLVRLYPPASADAKVRRRGALALSGAALLAAVAAALLLGGTGFMIFLALLFAVVLPLGAYGLRGRRAAERSLFGSVARVLRFGGVCTVALVGFALPAVLLLLVAEQVGAPVRDDYTLYLAVLVIFIGILSMLPAQMFFLFDQQVVEKVRGTFLREVLQLHPGLQTLDEADAAFGPLVDTAYGGRGGQVLRVATIPVLISTLLLTIGWSAALLPTVEEMRGHLENIDAIGIAHLMVPKRTPFTFALLGAYFFTLNMVFRRYVRADLGPKAYSQVTMRVIMAMVLAWVAGTLPQLAPAEGQPAAWLLLLVAFFVGIVPETGLALFHDVLQSQAAWIGKVIPSLSEPDPLNSLQGITLYDRARLLEEGIENVENLAHHNLLDLMLRTRIPTSRLVDVMDQAILYLHVRDAQPGTDPCAALGVLRGVGVRTATDLLSALQAVRGTPLEDGMYALLGDQGGVPRLRVIEVTLQDDEWMTHLWEWRRHRATYDQVYSYESFYPEHVVRVAPAPPADAAPPPALAPVAA